MIAAFVGLFFLGLIAAVRVMLYGVERQRPLGDSGPRSFSLSPPVFGSFAFATGIGYTLPMVGAPLRALAALVAYSRVHTGVHYPGDVVAGALLGATFAQLTATPTLPTAYSMMRSQPMIQASSSPSVAYEYVYAEPEIGTIAANSA